MAKTIPQGPKTPAPPQPTPAPAGTLETPEQLVTRMNNALAKYPLEDVNRIISSIVDAASKRLVETHEAAQKENDRVGIARKEFLSMFQKQ